MENRNEDTHKLVQRQLQDVIFQQQATIDSLRNSLDERESSIPFSEHKAVVRQLEDEHIAHASTTAKLMECEDKLDFALGEIEILRKQLEREKRQFDQTFGKLKTKALQETVKAVALESKCQVIKLQNENQEDKLYVKEQQIKTLSNKLQNTKHVYNQQLAELDVQMQQEAYVAKLMEEQEIKSERQKNKLSGRIDK